MPALTLHEHRSIQKRIVASQWFRSIQGAVNTIQGYEAMHMIRKRTDLVVTQGRYRRSAPVCEPGVRTGGPIPRTHVYTDSFAILPIRVENSSEREPVR